MNNLKWYFMNLEILFFRGGIYLLSMKFIVICIILLMIWEDVSMVNIFLVIK